MTEQCDKKLKIESLLQAGLNYKVHSSQAGLGPGYCVQPQEEDEQWHGYEKSSRNRQVVRPFLIWMTSKGCRILNFYAHQVFGYGRFKSRTRTKISALVVMENYRAKGVTNVFKNCKTVRLVQFLSKNMSFCSFNFSFSSYPEFPFPVKTPPRASTPPP